MRKPVSKILSFSSLIACTCAMLLITASVSLAISTIKVRGGVIYPKTGDSTRTRYNIDREVANYLEPGMVIGVLPSNCTSAAKGSVGNYYSCAEDIYLKPVFHGDKLVYQVIDRP